jgi:fatty-acyl-CoA synthase
MKSKYNKVNYENLTPISFLNNAFLRTPQKVAIIYEKITRTYEEYYYRVLTLALSLTKKCKVKPNTKIAIMLHNTHEMLELHYAVPLIGACLCPINIRLDPKTIAYILKHSDCEVFIWDNEFDSIISEVFTFFSLMRKNRLNS